MDVGKLIASGVMLIVILVVPFIPIAVLVHWLSPTTFWQNLATVGVMAIFYTTLLCIWGTFISFLLDG